MDCQKCFLPLPVQTGRGGKRRYHVECSPKAPKDGRAPVAVLPKVSTGGRVQAATLAELEASSRALSPDGVVALHLAQMLDAGDYNAQGAAALAKSHAEALTRALRGAAPAGDAVDELRERRAARRGA